jgi:hypothetical protein
MHKRVLGVAVGVTAASLAFLLTVFHLLVAPGSAASVELLSQYFYGYRVSWTGALVGAWWGGIVGFVAGWFLAFVRNFVMAAWLLSRQMKAELFLTRDFLDSL